MTREELKQIVITPPDAAVYAKVKQNWDALAKPLDGMGEFEDIFAKIGAVTGDETVSVEKKAVLVMCADNGIVEEHISQSGQEVTARVAQAMGKGISSVCRLAKQTGADVIPVDIGIAAEESIEGVLNRKVRCGTGNFLKEAAMTEAETLAAVSVGIDLVKHCKEQGYRLLATGEMGIGNTTTSSAVAAAITGCPVETLTGKGAGLSDEGLRHKIEVSRQGIRKHGCDRADVLSVLSAVGGLDIAGLCGVYIGGALCHIPVVMDGVISAVAALAAERLVPGTKEFILPSHQSREPAAELIMKELGVKPLLHAGLALGEGTGAVLLFGLLDIVHGLYGNKTTFADIEVEKYTRF